MANRILGWNTYSQQLARQLAMRDDITHSILWRRPHSLSTLLVKRHDVSNAARLYRRIDPISAYRSWLGGEIRREVRRQRPDAIHSAAHWPAAAIPWQDNCAPFTVAPDCTMAAMNKSLRREIWSHRETRAEAKLYRRAAKVFAMSSWAAQSVIDDARVPGANARILPPSIDLSAFRPPGRTGEKANIIFIGNDFIRKGGGRLVRWVKEPLKDMCHLHIASSDPGSRVECVNITWQGTVPHGVHCAELLPKMDILCLATRLDMSLHVLAEAAAAGLAVVASDLSGIPDIVLRGQTGILVDVGDDAGFISSLSTLITNRDYRAQMQQAALAHASKTLDASRNFGDLADTLAEFKQRSFQ